MSAESHCSSGYEVEVYWRFCSAAEAEEHIDEIVDALIAVLSEGSRVWNPWSKAAIEAILRGRLRKAARGELKPVDEVKPVRNRTMFEIRWLDLNVSQKQGGQLQHIRTGARLIHAEPSALGVALLGLVVHEKPHAPGAKALQDEHLDTAEHILVRTENTTWGVTPRG